MPGPSAISFASQWNIGFRPPLVKNRFLWAGWAKKNGQSGGRNFFFFPDFIFINKIVQGGGE